MKNKISNLGLLVKRNELKNVIGAALKLVHKDSLKCMPSNAHCYGDKSICCSKFCGRDGTCA